MTSEQTAAQFVDERLQKLHEIDEKIVALLEHVSSTIENVRQGQIDELKSGGAYDHDEVPKQKLKQSVSSFYADLEHMSSRLRREVILMDKKTAFNSVRENDVSLLPILINKKASWVGDWKFKNQVNEIKELLNNDPNFDRKFEFPKGDRKDVIESDNYQDGDGKDNGKQNVQASSSGAPQEQAAQSQLAPQTTLSTENKEIKQEASLTQPAAPKPTVASTATQQPDPPSAVNAANATFNTSTNETATDPITIDGTTATPVKTEQQPGPAIVQEEAIEILSDSPQQDGGGAEDIVVDLGDDDEDDDDDFADIL